MASHYASEVITAAPDTPVRELARRMSAHAVGSVVIVDANQQPVGIVTDRDLCCRVIGRPSDFEATRASAVMSTPLECARSDEPLEAVVERMRKRGVRRLPVLRDGRLSGIVSLDDVLVWVSRQLDDLSQGTRREITRATTRARRREQIGAMGRWFVRQVAGRSG